MMADWTPYYSPNPELDALHAKISELERLLDVAYAEQALAAATAAADQAIIDSYRSENERMKGRLRRLAFMLGDMDIGITVELKEV